MNDGIGRVGAMEPEQQQQLSRPRNTATIPARLSSRRWICIVLILLVLPLTALQWQQLIPTSSRRRLGMAAASAGTPTDHNSQRPRDFQRRTRTEQIATVFLDTAAQPYRYATLSPPEAPTSPLAAASPIYAQAAREFELDALTHFWQEEEEDQEEAPPPPNHKILGNGDTISIGAHATDSSGHRSASSSHHQHPKQKLRFPHKHRYAYPRPTLHQGIRDTQHGAATGSLKDTRDVDGWLHLRIQTNPQHDDIDALFAAGYLEGAIMHGEIYDAWQNFNGQWFTHQPRKHPEKLVHFVREHMKWLRHTAAQRARWGITLSPQDNRLMDQALHFEEEGDIEIMQQQEPMEAPNPATDRKKTKQRQRQKSTDNKNMRNKNAYRNDAKIRSGKSDEFETRAFVATKPRWTLKRTLSPPVDRPLHNGRFLHGRGLNTAEIRKGGREANQRSDPQRDGGMMQSEKRNGEGDSPRQQHRLNRSKSPLHAWRANMRGAVYWSEVMGLLAQFDGMVAGYQDAAPPNHFLPRLELLYMTLDGDFEALIPKLAPPIPVAANADQQNNATYDVMLAQNAHLRHLSHYHCSGLVRLVPSREGGCAYLNSMKSVLPRTNNTEHRRHRLREQQTVPSSSDACHCEIFVGHDTWDSFGLMLRVFKHYDFQLNGRHVSCGEIADADSVAGYEADAHRSRRFEWEREATVTTEPRSGDGVLFDDREESHVGRYDTAWRSRSLLELERRDEGFQQTSPFSQAQMKRHEALRRCHVGTSGPRSISFSSSPGFLSSVDDYLLSDKGLAIIETTNGLFNENLFELIQPENVVMSWMRSLVATALASSGRDWVRLFSRFNSGTYNDQWMVVDLKQVNMCEDARNPFFSHPSQPVSSLSTSGSAGWYREWQENRKQRSADTVPEDRKSNGQFKEHAKNIDDGTPYNNGLLVVLEQVPLYCHAVDLSEKLYVMGYHGSYNIPMFPDVFDLSGFSEMENTHAKEVAGVGHVNLYSYERCPRAMIFYRDAPFVYTHHDMAALMTYNEWQNDPLSLGDPGNAISAREDLWLRVKETEGGHIRFRKKTAAYGGIDSKFTSFFLSTRMVTQGMNGPTNFQQASFTWLGSAAERFASISHAGQPDVFSFNFVGLAPVPADENVLRQKVDIQKSLHSKVGGPFYFDEELRTLPVLDDDESAEIRGPDETSVHRLVTVSALEMDRLWSDAAYLECIDINK